MTDDHEPLRPLSESQKEAMEEAAAAYAGSITEAAAHFLLARGVSRETALAFRLGSVVDPFPGHERFVGWLAIPYLDRDGTALSMRFRCLQQHDHRDYAHGKYQSMTGEPSRVFNVKAIHEADDEIHVTEGEFDAMILSQVGLYAVAIPGAMGWKGHHRRMLAGFSRIYVWGDPDDAGAEFTQKVVRSLRSARGVRLRQGDVTDTYLSGGADALLSLIKRGSD